MKKKKTLRTPLVGWEWSRELDRDLTDRLAEVELVELIPENFFDGNHHDFLRALARRGTPVAVHGVNLSIGTLAPLDRAHLDRQLAIAAEVNTVNFSEHLAMTRVKSIDLDVLTPLDWSRKLAAAVCRKVEAVQKRLRVPFLLENVSNRFMLPGTELTETAFVNEILDRTGCGLLLDVTNVYTNAVNFDFDPRRWVDEIPLDRVGLVHLAGGYYTNDGFLNDSHDSAVPPGAWELYRYVCRDFTPPLTVIERTDNYPGFAALGRELDRARRIAA